MPDVNVFAVYNSGYFGGAFLVKGRVINVSYSVDRSNNLYLNWVVRSNDGKLFVKTISDLPPRCFIPSFMAKEVPNNYTVVRRPDRYFAMEEYRQYDVLEVRGKIPTDISSFRHLFRDTPYYRFVHEADVPYTKVYLVNKGIGLAVDFDESSSFSPRACDLSEVPEYRFLVFDIETDDGGSIAETINGDRRILSIAARDLYSDKKWFFCGVDEVEEVIKPFFKLLDDYDVVIGFNSDNFDLPVLKARSKKLRVDYYDWRQCVFVDYMKVFLLRHRHFAGKKYVNLDLLGGLYLGVNKITHEQSFNEMFDDYVSGRSDLLERYNHRDNDIVVDLEKMFGFVNLNVRISEIIGYPITINEFATGPSELGIFRKSREYGAVWPSRPSDDEKETRKSFTGAVVIDPKAGMYKNVVIDDFTSLYNRILQTFSMCPSRWDSNERSFVGDREPIFSDLAEEWEALRNGFKAKKKKAKDKKEESAYDALQAGAKILLLAVWGMVGRIGSRFYCYGMANTITRYGRAFLIGDDDLGVRGASRIASSLSIGISSGVAKVVVIYGDTDSIMMHVKTDSDGEISRRDWMIISRRITAEINRDINRYLAKHGVSKERQRMNMELQGIYKAFIVTDKKKRHAELLVFDGNKWLDHPKAEYKGFEFVRFDREAFLRTVQKTVILRLLNGDDPEAVLAGLKKIQKGLFNGLYDHKLVITTGISKKIDEYKSLTPAVRVAKKLRDMGVYRPGQSVEYVIVRSNGTVEVEPVVNGVLPKIRSSGRVKYWKRLFSSIRDVLLLFFEEKRLNAVFDDYVVNGDKISYKQKLTRFFK